MYISFININHVQLYFFVSGNIYVHFIVIYLLSFHSENNPDQYMENMYLFSETHFFHEFPIYLTTSLSKVCRPGTRWMWNIIGRPMSAYTLNLSKPISK